MMAERDGEIIRHIAAYCEQIGELVGRLSDDFKARHPEIPWRQIRGMRNFVAHEYGSLDLEVVWYTANEGVAELSEFCHGIVH